MTRRFSRNGLRKESEVLLGNWFGAPGANAARVALVFFAGERTALDRQADCITRLRYAGCIYVSCPDIR